MRLTTKADLMLKTAPNSAVFIRPKSFGAHDAICGLLDWACAKMALFNNKPNELMLRFGEVYDQLRYEEAEQLYDMEHYVKLISGTPGDKKNTGYKAKTDADVLSVLSLELLMTGEWARDNCVKARPRTATIAQHRELYNYIVDKFICSNFSLSDLNKIADMGVICNLPTIIKEASKITDQDKHSISYLYAIIRSINSKEEITKFRNNISNSVNAERVDTLYAMYAGVTEKEPFISDSNSLEKWDIEREFIDAYRDLLNK